MGDAFDAERLAELQRAYDEVLKDLFGEALPDLPIRESIACAILCSARAGQSDWEKLADYAGAQTLRMLRDRSLLMRHEKGDCRSSESKVA